LSKISFQLPYFMNPGDGGCLFSPEFVYDYFSVMHDAYLYFVAVEVAPDIVRVYAVTRPGTREPQFTCYLQLWHAIKSRHYLDHLIKGNAREWTTSDF